MKDTRESSAPNSEELQQNLSRIGELTTRLVAALSKNDSSKSTSSGLDQELYTKAFTASVTDMMNNPARLIEQQVGYWKEAVESWAPNATADGNAATQKKTDRRFRDPLWSDNPFYTAMADQYLQASKAIQNNAQGLSGLDQTEQRRLDFFTQQYVSMLSPGNFLPTNPEALNKAVETNGQSLIQGLENLVKDLEFNDGRYGVSLADRDAFEIGKNIATTPGEVVFQNRLFQLIQYTPTTEDVNETPLVIFPPWINKYYVLDLQEANSFIKFATDAGNTVFVVSWVNPDDSFEETAFDAYMTEGSLVAINEVRKITSQEKVNTIGYCIGGTLMACTLAWLAKKKLDLVNSATFFTTLTDFQDPGELGVFIEEEGLASIRKMSEERGIIDSYYIGQIFSFLRPDNLIYGPAIKSYMMGEKPPAFDLLYWNGDSPNLPGRMATEYLEKLYVRNELVEGVLEFGGEVLNMEDITLPIYSVATETDHIAPWKASFNGMNRISSKSARFVLSGSGHIAGIINAADSTKYGYKTNPARPDDLDAWQAAAKQHEGSWWNDWATWINAKSGASTPARTPGDVNGKTLESAPGSYVKA